MGTVVALTPRTALHIVGRLVGGLNAASKDPRLHRGSSLRATARHGIAAAQAQGAQGAAAPDATAGADRVRSTLTPAEELTQSEAFLVRMDSARTGVRRQLETARAQRDVVKTLCLNDKLNQLDVAVRSARERREALAAAVQRSDADLATHEFTILSVLRQRSDQLTAEANQCIGEEAGVRRRERRDEPRSSRASRPIRASGTSREAPIVIVDHSPPAASCVSCSPSCSSGRPTFLH